MKTPGFTAEASCYQTRSSYSNRGKQAFWSVAPTGLLSLASITCGADTCHCEGLLDCIDMGYLSGLCAQEAEGPAMGCQGSGCTCWRHHV